MKLFLAACVCTIFYIHAGAQYYYLDIAGTEQTNARYQKLHENQLQKISAVSFEGNSQPSTDFVLEQTINNTSRQIITHSATVNSGESFFTSFFNENGKLVKTVDSSSNAINTVVYQYDDNGRLLSTRQTSADFDGKFNSAEDHKWQYNSNGKPVAMIKTKNGADTLQVSFKLDEAGNVAEEAWRKNNRTIETYYYYYNAKNQLTDIVRYNRKAQRMLPDFMFEYDAAGNLSQMTQTQGASANYLVWRYVFNNKGLKEKEFVFNKQKELLGKIEYTYQ